MRATRRVAGGLVAVVFALDRVSTAPGPQPAAARAVVGFSKAIMRHCGSRRRTIYQSREPTVLTQSPSIRAPRHPPPRCVSRGSSSSTSRSTLESTIPKSRRRRRRAPPLLLRPDGGTRAAAGRCRRLPRRCSITPDVLQHRDELSKFVGDEISRIIHEQRQLEARYESLIAQRGALKVRRRRRGGVGRGAVPSL